MVGEQFGWLKTYSQKQRRNSSACSPPSSLLLLLHSIKPKRIRHSLFTSAVCGRGHTSFPFPHFGLPHISANFHECVCTPPLLPMSAGQNNHLCRRRRRRSFLSRPPLREGRRGRKKRNSCVLLMKGRTWKEKEKEERSDGEGERKWHGYPLDFFVSFPPFCGREGGGATSLFSLPSRLIAAVTFFGPLTTYGKEEEEAIIISDDGGGKEKEQEETRMIIFLHRCVSSLLPGFPPCPSSSSSSSVCCSGNGVAFAVFLGKLPDPNNIYPFG